MSVPPRFRFLVQTALSRKETENTLGLIVHNLRAQAIRNMSLVGGSETDIMAVSGRKINATFKRCNITSLQQIVNLEDKVEQHEQVTRAAQPGVVGEIVSRKALRGNNASTMQVDLK